ncbi:manganese efflux pump [Clostridium senegalense]|uniref:manganese efflux pump n=1 Tax=Clostridium senegalense TaxID=1465809 RepID=UPI0002887661|nr:manganese efflux pump [Clostridium senegalense]
MVYIRIFYKILLSKEKEKNKLDNMIGEYKNILDNPELVDSDNSSCIDVKESILLAFALTINNLGVGIGASITGLNIFLTTIFTFIFSLLFIILGYLIGTSYLSKLFGKYASLISGAIIIFLGCYELFI